jgi:hypothetical protein
MEDKIKNEINKSYSTLIALKNNLPTSKDVEEKYAKIYNTEVGRLTSLGFEDLEEFKIPEHEIRSVIVAYFPDADQTDYSKERYVDREFFLIKIDSILGFFSINSEKKEIGFEV